MEEFYTKLAEFCAKCLPLVLVAVVSALTALLVQGRLEGRKHKLGPRYVQQLDAYEKMLNEFWEPIAGIVAINFTNRYNEVNPGRNIRWDVGGLEKTLATAIAETLGKPDEEARCDARKALPATIKTLEAIRVECQKEISEILGLATENCPETNCPASETNPTNINRNLVEALLMTPDANGDYRDQEWAQRMAPRLAEAWASVPEITEDALAEKLANSIRMTLSSAEEESLVVARKIAGYVVDQSQAIPADGKEALISDRRSLMLTLLVTPDPQMEKLSQCLEQYVARELQIDTKEKFNAIMLANVPECFIDLLSEMSKAYREAVDIGKLSFLQIPSILKDANTSE